MRVLFTLTLVAISFSVFANQNGSTKNCRKSAKVDMQIRACAEQELVSAKAKLASEMEQFDLTLNRVSPTSMDGADASRVDAIDETSSTFVATVTKFCIINSFGTEVKSVNTEIIECTTEEIEKRIEALEKINETY